LLSKISSRIANNSAAQVSELRWGNVDAVVRADGARSLRYRTHVAPLPPGPTVAAVE